jgi:hypothetical protein
MRSRLNTLVLFALLALPTVASAGPIDISYRAHWNVLAGPGQHDPGPLEFSLDAGGNVSWTEQSGSLALGSVRFGHSPGPQNADSYTAHTSFEVTVVVTDQLTGESVDLILPGAALDMWDYREWDGLWRNSDHRLELGDSFSGNSARVSAEIGHTRFTLDVQAEDDHQTGAYTLTATAHNPEPGTLALAALGLAPLALRAVRRAKQH